MTSAIPVYFFQVSSFQLLYLKHLHFDDLHIILSLSAVQIYDYFIYSSVFTDLLLLQKARQNRQFIAEMFLLFLEFFG